MVCTCSEAHPVAARSIHVLFSFSIDNLERRRLGAARARAPSVLGYRTYWATRDVGNRLEAQIYVMSLSEGCFTIMTVLGGAPGRQPCPHRSPHRRTAPTGPGPTG